MTPSSLVLLQYTNVIVPAASETIRSQNMYPAPG